VYAFRLRERDSNPPLSRVGSQSDRNPIAILVMNPSLGGFRSLCAIGEGLLGDFGAALEAFFGFQPQLDLVLSSQTFLDSARRGRGHGGPGMGGGHEALRVRNHIAFYTADVTLSCDKGYVDGERRLRVLAERFVVLSYSGRVDCNGQCHVKGACCRGCYGSQHVVVIPSVVPQLPGRTPAPAVCASRAAARTSTFRFDLEGGWSRILWDGKKELVSDVQLERTAVVRLVGQWSRRTLATRDRSNQSWGALHLLNTNRSDFASYYGLHAAGYGTWSARLWDFVSRCVIPVVFTDGVILPFERHVRYELFSAKMHPARVPSNRTEPSNLVAAAFSLLDQLLVVAERSAARSQVATPGAGIDPLVAVMAALKSVSGWLDWRSDRSHQHPFTLTMIDLLCFTAHAHRSELVRKMCERDSSRVASKQYLPTPIGDWASSGRADGEAR